MRYDKAVLKAWAEMETWSQFLERNGAFGSNVSREGFKFIEQRYYKKVKKRIECCKRLLPEHDDFYMLYTLAELCNRGNLDDSAEYLFKRSVRYYCIKAIKKSPSYAPAWALLAEAYEWVACLGGDGKSISEMETIINESNIIVQVSKKGSELDPDQESIRFIEKAIRCLKKAVLLDPGNYKYERMLKNYYQYRFEEDERLFE